jgi:hypothetical protein
VSTYFFFFGEAAFLALGEAEEAEAVLAVFGLGAFGFFVGPLLDFFAFVGDFALAAAVAAPAVDCEAEAFEEAAFFSPAVSFFALAALAFLADAFLAGDAFFAAFGLSPLAALFAGDFFLAAPAFFFSPPAGFEGFDPEDANLKDPEAPFPLVCTKAPDATEAFKYFLMNGATFSASTL